MWKNRGQFVALQPAETDPGNFPQAPGAGDVALRQVLGFRCTARVGSCCSCCCSAGRGDGWGEEAARQGMGAVSPRRLQHLLPGMLGVYASPICAPRH